MTRAEYILQLAEDLKPKTKKPFKIDKAHYTQKNKKIKQRDLRDARALNKAFAGQFAAMGGAGLHKAHKAAKAGGLYTAAGKKLGFH
jgi:hypothetical protein